MEVWKNVDRWDGGLYEVSSEGRVRRGMRILRPSTVSRGYKQATASLGGKRVIRQALVHQLVAEAFIGDIPASMQVNHLNGIKSDNRVENLEIVTAAANNLHAYRVLNRERMCGSKHHASKLTEAAVLDIRKLVEAGASQTELARKHQVDKTTIRDIVHRKKWTHI